MGRKLFVCDVDNTTLTPGETSFSPKIIDAFNKIINGGNRLMVASGRTYYNLRKLFNNNDDVIYLCENGGLLVENQRDLFVNEMDHETAIELGNTLLSLKLPFEICTSHKIYYFGKNEKDCTWFSSLIGNPVECISSFDEVKETILKISYFKMIADNDFTEIKEKLFKMFGSKLETFDPNCNWIDFSPLNVSKGLILKKYMTKKRINKKDVYAFGDADNDISLFNVSGNSYCKEDGLESAKKYAKYTFKTFDLAIEDIVSVLNKESS